MTEPLRKTRSLSEADMRNLVKDAVRETLTGLGIDVSSPAEMQRDLIHLRQWRQSVEAMKRQGLITGVVLFVTGVIGLIWVAIKGS